MKELKSQVDAILDPATAATCGYITPSAEIHVRQLQLSYWKTRNALYELVYDIWRDIERIDRATPEQFLVALAAASLLVDAARFLREKFHRCDVIRRKLDEPDIVHGIPPRMYDEVQKSLTSSYHAWYLWQATRYYDRHRDRFLESARSQRLEPMIAIIDRLRDRLRPSLPMYLRTRVKVRGRRAVRRIGRDVLGRGVYGLQEALGRGMARVSTRPGHAPSLPREIRAQFIELLRPGDVLVVRKEFAATQLLSSRILAARRAVFGHGGRFAAARACRRQTCRSSTFATCRRHAFHGRAASRRDECLVGGEPHPCVLEAIKDGVCASVRSIRH